MRTAGVTTPVISPDATCQAGCGGTRARNGCTRNPVVRLSMWSRAARISTSRRLSPISSSVSRSAVSSSERSCASAAPPGRPSWPPCMPWLPRTTNTSRSSASRSRNTGTRTALGLRDGNSSIDSTPCLTRCGDSWHQCSALSRTVPKLALPAASSPASRSIQSRRRRCPPDRHPQTCACSRRTAPRHASAPTWPMAVPRSEGCMCTPFDPVGLAPRAGTRRIPATGRGDAGARGAITALCSPSGGPRSPSRPGALPSRARAGAQGRRAPGSPRR
jgi:hypothetical protein